MSETDTRDHLANERTFLAWVRTSISLLGFGVVIARLRFLTVGGGVAPVPAPHAGARATLLGLAFAGVGLLTLVFAWVHYEATRRAILAGDYRTSGRFLLAFTAVLCLLALTTVAYLLSLSSH